MTNVDKNFENQFFTEELEEVTDQDPIWEGRKTSVYRLYVLYEKYRGKYQLLLDRIKGTLYFGRPNERPIDVGMYDKDRKKVLFWNFRKITSWLSI